MIIGLVGKANTGKSTFFKASTLADVLIANYPFATIDPNKGFAHVRIDCVDKEFNTQCNPRYGYCINNQRFVPFELIDVAGLVPGAHEGKGMGNRFLDDLRQADVFIHVVDASGSSNEKGEPVEPGKYDPVFDVKFLEFELDMWVLSIIKKGWDKFARQVQQEQSDVVLALAKQLSGLNIKEEHIKKALSNLSFSKEQLISWAEEDLHKLAVQLRLLTKPMVIAANKIDVHSAKENIERLKKAFPNHIIIPCAADAELALREAAKKNFIKYLPGDSKFEIIGGLSPKQRLALEFIQKKILDVFGSTGIQQILNTAVFDLLGAIAIFPGGVNKLADKDGNVLPDCFLLPKNSTAIDFAYHLHTDLGKNFIRAINVKTKMSVGKDHMLKHRDVVEIITRK
ncbi:redox-regulated ATPase YchF [Candidatus Woesearchaeota archaeon]|nr:redox-regulated ATPase YchF [Candidatus Woesearchaeota archaeon]